MLRKLIYENSAGSRLNLTADPDCFLYDLTGMGYSYKNEITSSEFDTYAGIESTEISQESPSGIYTISADDYSDIYELKDYAEKILNYDQLVNRASTTKVCGKLYYMNSLGKEVYAKALLKTFSFGEISEDYELQVTVEFDMVSKNWISSSPQTYSLSFSDETQTLSHPFSHPFSHPADATRTKMVAAVGGSDVAYGVLTVAGLVEDPTITVKNKSTGESHVIKYDGTIEEGSSLVLDMINLSAAVDGVNAIADFDIVNGSIPFFVIIPGTYEISIEATENTGSIKFEIYESYVGG